MDGPTRLHNWRLMLDSLATVALIVTSCVVIWAVVDSRSSTRPPPNRIPSRPPKPVPTAPVSLTGAQLLGNSAARVAVIEFSDFECPFCARFFDSTFKTIFRSHIETGKILFAFRHLPLDQKHASAFVAAEAAECSGRQGRFWPMHDELFAPPRELNYENFMSMARRIGLDSGRFRRCMDGEAGERIRQDVAEAQKLSIAGTPSFLFGTVEPDKRVKIVRHESGAIPVKVFARILDDLLTSANPSKP
ncbi:MAG TPA: thioredoxin domain-containing protein [Vicinamibacterales bacterium]|jgi:protein-disulfide isomerase